ncbi:sigma-70 family RNA polymerase sigma factor [Lacunisphaera limnophila]|nr:sigma-70 family RNA polymerase sigma factor [Lacunisphaera limnophila]
MPSLDLISDAELVAASLAGDRVAFSRIVERYQRLLCSLAYSSTGQLSQSEDLAQEAFLEAWRQLGSLREPEKLRSWLCGILRHKVGRLRRTDGKEPVRQAGTLEDAGEVVSAEMPVADQAMQQEEQAILWSALERVPALYREPLVLYYREHRSVEHVADALDLTEDTVKQRLARGRHILQEQVLAFVEGALVRSTPGNMFTVGVLAALPAFPDPVETVGIGTAAAHGSMLAKTTGIAALVASLSGVASAVMALRSNLDQSRTPRERRAVVKATGWIFFGALGFLVAWYLLRAGAFRWWDQRVGFAVGAQALLLVTVVIWPVALMRTMRYMRRLRSAERRAHPELFQDARDQVGSTAGQYKSRFQLLGVPLVHIRFSTPDEGERPVFGWLAAGDRAYGLLFAWGGYAVAPVSVGAISVGVLTVGSLSIGFISLGTVAVGAFALGCVSVGVKAYAWLSALGWITAQSGGFAVAWWSALAPVALAPHANDAVARGYLDDPTGGPSRVIIFIVISLLTLIPVAYYARAVRRRMGQKVKS